MYLLYLTIINQSSLSKIVCGVDTVFTTAFSCKILVTQCFLYQYTNSSSNSIWWGSVERGLMELKRLGIEEQLWNVSRREIAHEAANQKVDVLEVLAPASLQRTISAPSIHNG